MVSEVGCCSAYPEILLQGSSNIYTKIPIQWSYIILYKIPTPERYLYRDTSPRIPNQRFQDLKQISIQLFQDPMGTTTHINYLWSYPPRENISADQIPTELLHSSTMSWLKPRNVIQFLKQVLLFLKTKLIVSWKLIWNRILTKKVFFWNKADELVCTIFI